MSDYKDYKMEVQQHNQPKSTNSINSFKDNSTAQSTTAVSAHDSGRIIYIVYDGQVSHEVKQKFSTPTVHCIDRDITRQDKTPKKFPTYTCTTCHAIFLSENGLKFHHRRKHSDDEMKRKFSSPKIVHYIDRNITPKKVPTYTCTTCHAMFSSENGLKFHLRHKHLDCEKKVPKIPKYTCTICNVKFTFKTNLYRHCRSKHPNIDLILENPHKQLGKCKCTECPFRTNAVRSLIDHYNTDHGSNIQILKQNFNSKEKFNQWKNDIEREHSTKYSLKSGKQERGGNTDITYFYCHRSGPAPSAQSRKKRSIKKQGSKKLDNVCTSFITASTNKQTGKVAVQYCLHHHGHTNEVSHLQLSQDIKLKVVDHLYEGLELAEILELLRVEPPKFERDSLINRSDIRNIKTQYHIVCNRSHKLDAGKISANPEGTAEMMDLICDENFEGESFTIEDIPNVHRQNNITFTSNRFQNLNFDNTLDPLTEKNRDLALKDVHEIINILQNTSNLKLIKEIRRGLQKALKVGSSMLKKQNSNLT